MFTNLDNAVIKTLANPENIQKIISEYQNKISILQPIWKARKHLSTKQELIDFFNIAVD
jgi:hypothetical protein